MSTVFRPDFRTPHDTPLRIPASHASAPITAEDTQDYFTEVAVDYSAWSPSYNMHFGFWRAGLNPLRREGMLMEMNRVVGRALQLGQARPGSAAQHRCVIDLGCGAGATARTIAGLFPRAEVTGVTLVHEQIALGVKLNRKAGLARRVGFVLSDFTETWTGSGSQDAAVAIESFCYAPGADKAAAVCEAARLLRPGSRLAVVDGFLVGSEPHGLVGWVYRRWCECWAIPELARLDDFKASLKRAGFVDVEVRNLFWHIAPSAAHIPFVALAHMVRALWEGRGRLSAWRWRHIGASWLSIALGLAPWSFRYCLVTARKA